MVYAVVDTNVLVSAALAKNRGESIPLKIFLGIAQKKYIPIIDSNIIEEYREVLQRGNLKHFPGCPFAISPKDFYELIRPTPSEFVVNEPRIGYDSSKLMQALYALNDEAHKNGTAGMSEKEIEAEIKAARAGRNP